MRRVQLLFKTHISSHTRHLASGKVVTVVEHEDKRTKAAKPMPKTVVVNGVERPTANSAGRPIHPTEEGIRNFWRWFGDSRVVDAEGRPLVMYHGTISEVAKFEHSAKKRTRGGRDGAFFFSPDADIASAYAGTAEGRQRNEASGMYDKVHYGMEEGGNVMSVYLSLKHPLVFDADGRVYDQIEDAAFHAAKSGKHDGIVFRNIVDQPGAQGSLRAYQSDAYVAFEPNQIKSAISNSGDFAPTDKTLTKSLPLAVRITRR